MGWSHVIRGWLHMMTYWLITLHHRLIEYNDEKLIDCIIILQAGLWENCRSLLLQLFLVSRCRFFAATWAFQIMRQFGSNANYDRWLRDSVISYVTFTFLSFILERMILCDLFWLASLFTKVTSGKSSHFLFKSKPFSHSPKVSFDIWLMWLWL